MGDLTFSGGPHLTTAEHAAIAGTSGTAPSGSNKFVDNADTRLSDARHPDSHADHHEAAGADRVTAIPKEINQAATDLLTAAECSNTIINNYGQSVANTQTLPAAAPGLCFVVFISAAGVGAFNVKAGAGDKIYLDGTALDDGDKVSCATPAVGNCCQFIAVTTGASAYDWYCSTISGVWTDGGA